MKLNKQGFTLIELLAVIVVLGIILAIAIPKITSTIQDSKEAAFKASVKNIIRSGEQYAIRKQLNNGEVVDVSDLGIKNTTDLVGQLEYNNGKMTVLSITDTKTNKTISNVTIDTVDTKPIETYYTVKNGEYGVTINGTSIADKEYSPTLIGYTGTSKNIKIPNGITSIGERSFTNSGLTSAIIPNSVTEIGGYAFSSNKLTNAIISNYVTSIGDSAFQSNQLTSVTIPDSVISIGDHAFMENKLTSVRIPNSVTSIGWCAFATNQLTSVTIPNSVTSIGDNTFRENQLTNVTIPDSVNSISWDAFSNNPLITIKNETGANFNWKNILGASSCTKLTGESDDNFITGSCNYNYDITGINGIRYVGNGTVNIIS